MTDKDKDSSSTSSTGNPGNDDSKDQGVKINVVGSAIHRIQRMASGNALIRSAGSGLVNAGKQVLRKKENASAIKTTGAQNKTGKSTPKSKDPWDEDDGISDIGATPVSSGVKRTKMLKIVKKKSEADDLDDDGDAADAVVVPGAPAVHKHEMTPSTRSGILSKRHDNHVKDDLEASVDDMKQKAYYSDDVMIKMTNLLYDPLTVELCTELDITDVAQLLGLTKINSTKEAFYWAHRLSAEVYANRYRPGGSGPLHSNGERKWSIDKVRMVAFLLAKRSLPGTVGGAFALGVGLAQEQAITRTEETDEGTDW